MAERIAKVGNEHPRILLNEDGWRELTRRAQSSPTWRKFQTHIVATADEMLDLAPVKRKLRGKRLLGVSRDCLRRVIYLSMAWRLTGQDRYADRAEKEMLAAAGMRNWNPSHFLDVAEMTTALALGYDWLYSRLDPEAREKIRQAIVDKGLKASLPKAWWQDATNNWNQVCHGGLTLGALAVLEHEPQLAGKILSRAIELVPKAMDHYAPDGAYPEGPGYWAYGTNYNVLMIDALQSVLGTDFGLSNSEGFLESSDYYLHASGPTGIRFGYSDCRPEPSGVQPAMFWFARLRKKPSLLWRQKPSLEALLAREPEGQGHSGRLLPLVLVWSGQMGQIQPPRDLHYLGRGPTPVGLHRNGWDSTATYVGIKAGSPGTNHAHMDIGSFIMESDGVRWAVDLGKQSYTPLEQAGVDLWNRGQKSQRWQVFRWSNYSHNTLVVDDKLQWVAGKAEILDHQADGKTGQTVIDMSPVYRFQLAKALRGVALRADGSVLVQDQIQARDKETEVRWAMVTTADVSLDGDKALLRDGQKKLALRVLAPAGAKFEVLDISKPRRDFDEPNPSAKMVTLTVTLSPEARERLVVLLSPGGREQIPEALPDLKDW
jgi:hypothetical protein